MKNTKEKKEEKKTEERINKRRHNFTKYTHIMQQI